MIVDPIVTAPQIDPIISYALKLDQLALEKVEGKREIWETDLSETIEPSEESLSKKPITIAESSSKAIEEEQEYIKAFDFDDDWYNEVLDDEDV